MVKFENCKPGMVVQCKETGRIGEIVDLMETDPGSKFSVNRVRVQFGMRHDPYSMMPSSLRSCHKRFVYGATYRDCDGWRWVSDGVWSANTLCLSGTQDYTAVKQSVKPPMSRVIPLGKTPEEAGYTPVWGNKLNPRTR